MLQLQSVEFVSCAPRPNWYRLTRGLVDYYVEPVLEAHRPRHDRLKKFVGNLLHGPHLTTWYWESHRQHGDDNSAGFIHSVVPSKSPDCRGSPSIGPADRLTSPNQRWRDQAWPSESSRTQFRKGGIACHATNLDRKNHRITRKVGVKIDGLRETVRALYVRLHKSLHRLALDYPDGRVPTTIVTAATTIRVDICSMICSPVSYTSHAPGP